MLDFGENRTVCSEGNFLAPYQAKKKRAKHEILKHAQRSLLFANIYTLALIHQVEDELV